MLYRNKIIIVLLLPVLLGACSKPSETDVALCESLAEVLELDEMQQQECLKNQELRADLIRMRDSQLARQLTNTYNSEKAGLEVADYRKAVFTKLSGVDDLIHVHDDFELAIRHRGRKYAVPGWVGLATITDPDADPFVYLYDLEKKDSDGLPLWRLAHLHDLNQAQKEFLGKYCMEDGVTESQGFCEGVLYVTVKPQPGNNTLLTFQLSGVDFAPLEIERVKQYFTQQK
jgi:hypothetical protein